MPRSSNCTVYSNWQCTSISDRPWGMVKNVGWTGRMLPSGVDTFPPSSWSPMSWCAPWWLLCCGGEWRPVPSSVEWDASSAICASALRAVAVISATSMLVTDWTDDVELWREMTDDFLCRWSCSALSFSAMLCIHVHKHCQLVAWISHGKVWRSLPRHCWHLHQAASHALHWFGLLIQMPQKRGLRAGHTDEPIKNSWTDHEKPAKREWCPFFQELDSRSRKDKATDWFTQSGSMLWVQFSAMTLSEKWKNIWL